MANTNLDYVSLLGRDSVVANGKISVPSHIKISGIVKMNIESEGKVVITDSGAVNGNIKGVDVQVYGKVNGDVIAAQKLMIGKTGDVKGRIASRILTIEEGATCNFEMAIGEVTASTWSSAMKEESAATDVDAKAAGKKNIPSVQASQKNGTNRESKDDVEKKPVDKKQTDTKFHKVSGDLPEEKGWLDRFW
ncbi:MAG: polymer-forming cytoskeletal protein [Balneolales bacterium]